MVVKTDGGRGIVFSSPAEPVHGLQRGPQTVDGADQTQTDAHIDHPLSPAEAVSQPDGQQYKACHRHGNAESQLGQPYGQSQVFHILLPTRLFKILHLILYDKVQ